VKDECREESMRNLTRLMALAALLMVGGHLPSADAIPPPLQHAASGGSPQFIGHKPKHRIIPGHPKHDPFYRGAWHRPDPHVRDRHRHEGDWGNYRSHWTAWDEYCASRYRSYDPETGLVRNYRGEWIPCFSGRMLSPRGGLAQP
jgi:hypothetical protein